MSPELAKDVREVFPGSPIKVTFDNMIIVYDRAVPESVVIWNDDEERFVAIRPNTDENQNPYPFEILFTEYEHIQFMEAYATPMQMLEWAVKMKDEGVLTADQYEQVMEQYKRAVARRQYTGSIRSDKL